MLELFKEVGMAVLVPILTAFIGLCFKLLHSYVTTYIDESRVRQREYEANADEAYSRAKKERYDMLTDFVVRAVEGVEQSMRGMSGDERFQVAFDQIISFANDQGVPLRPDHLDLIIESGVYGVNMLSDGFWDKVTEPSSEYLIEDE